MKNYAKWGVCFLCTCCFLFFSVYSKPAVAETINLNYAAGMPAPAFPCIQMERWKNEVEKRTNGKVSIRTFPGGTLLKDKMMVDGVKLGQADMGIVCMAYQPGRFIVTNAVSLPLQLPNAYVAGRTLFDLYKKYKPKEFEGLKVITMFTSAPSNLMMRGPIRTLDDLKGANVRASGMAAQVLEIWQANPVGMPMPETPEALQKGVVSGLFSSLEVMKDFKFAEICKYITITDAVVYPFAVIMNERKWHSLPEDVKKVIDDMALEQCIWTGKYMDNHVVESIAWSRENQSVEVIELSEEQSEKWNAMLDPMVESWIEDATAKGFPGAQIIEDIKTFRDKYMQQ